MSHAFQQCIHPDCQARYDIAQVLTACEKCGSLLDVGYDWDRVPVPRSLSEFERRWSSRLNPLDFSGVWRFRELISFPKDEDIVTIGEGQTILQRNDRLAKTVGILKVLFSGKTKRSSVGPVSACKSVSCKDCRSGLSNVIAMFAA